MKILAIDMDARSHEPSPTGVVAALSRRELEFISHILGKMSPLNADEALSGYRGELASIYAEASNALFNRFWEDGLEGAIRESRS